MTAQPKDELDRLLSRARSLDGVESADCPDETLLAKYRAHALDEAAEERIDAHLATCAGCRSSLSHLARPVDVAAVSWSSAAPKSRRRLLPLIAAALIAGVLVPLMVQPLIRGGESNLEAFVVEAPSGGVSLVRGTAAQTSLFVPESAFELVVRVAEDPGRARAIVFLEEPDGLLRRLEERLVQRASSGATRVVGPARDIFGAFGRYIVHIVISEADEDTLRSIGSQTVAEAKNVLKEARWESFPIEYAAEARN